jgi:pimeloyl-ACP methyl ester carboxylesterase
MIATDRGQFAIHSIDPPGRREISGSVLCVPGFTGSKEDFLPLLEPLADAGFRVRAMDQRGQYETPGPDDPAAYAIDELGADILAVAADLPGPVHLVGHSFGGFPVRAAAITDPTAVSTVTLLCSGPGPLTVQREIDRAESLIAALENFPLSAIWSFIETMDEAAGNYEGVSAEVRKFLQDRFVRSAPVGLSRMAAQLLDLSGRLEELAAGGVPVLVAHGVDDFIWLPADQERMAIDLGASYRVIIDAAHSPAVENPHATAALLAEFWASHERGDLTP